MDLNTQSYRQPWLGRPVTEFIFILLPPFLCLLLIALCPALFQNAKGMSDAWWVILMLLVDVAHVYSTLYRTYFDRNALSGRRSLLWIIPVIAFAAAVLLYTSSSHLFWRVLAYIAVFHFVRQQYGFLRLYSRSEQVPRIFHRIDTWVIYGATIYPLLYWHLSERNFNWFVDGDFVRFQSSGILGLATTAYWLLLAIYVVKELVLYFRLRCINLPRVAILTGTILSWYFGIVYFNGDMAFTLLNVVSHGIPYMALVWISGKKQQERKDASGVLRLVFREYGWVLFLLIIFLLAYVEEGLWDITLWKEHTSVFNWLHGQQLQPGDALLGILVPLLALPQLTHYIIDGFIWKRRDLQ
jgi:cbb3-type cytochrome oxidase subunit 3